MGSKSPGEIRFRQISGYLQPSSLQFIFLVLGFSQVAYAVDEFHVDLVKSTTYVSPIKDIYLVKGYLSFDVPIHILEVQSSLDALRYNLGNLQYANSYEKLRPKVLQFNEARGEMATVTIFRHILSISNVASICSKMELDVLDLDNLPQSMNIPVILHTEVHVEDQTPICIGVDSYRKGEACLTYLLSKTTRKEFPRTKQALLANLLALKGSKLFMHADDNRFILSPTSRGMSGCLGSVNAPKDSSISSVHNRYYSALGSTFLSLFDAIGDYISVFASNVHTLSMEGQPLPSEIIDTESLIKGLIELVPTFIPNGVFPLGSYPSFEKLFLKEIANSKEDLIRRFADRDFLQSLRQRDIKQAYNAMKEFDTNVKYRFTRFFKFFGENQFDRLIPKTLLMKKDQNPTTFSSIVRSMIPEVDDHILIDTFSILQNCKMTLLKDLGRFVGNTAEIRFIKHRQLFLAKAGEGDEVMDFDSITSDQNKPIKPRKKQKPGDADKMSADDRLSPDLIRILTKAPNYALHITSELPTQAVVQTTTTMPTSQRSPLVPRDNVVFEEDDENKEDIQGEDSLSTSNNQELPAQVAGSSTESSVMESSTNNDSGESYSSVTSSLSTESPNSAAADQAPEASSSSNAISSTADSDSNAVSSTSESNSNAVSSTPEPDSNAVSGTTTITTSSTARPIPSTVHTTVSSTVVSSSLAPSTERTTARLKATIPIARSAPTTTRTSSSSPNRPVSVPRNNLIDDDSDNSEVPQGYARPSSQKTVKHRIIREISLLNRVKRSGWLTSVFGVATSDDIVGLFNSEVNLHEREEEVEKHIANITASTNKMLFTIKNVTDDIEKLAKADSDMFQTLEQLTKQESTSMETLKKVAVTLDRLTVISSEYHSLATQTTLLLHSLEKAHALVQSGLNNIIDVARLPLEVLDNVLSNHIKVSLQSASVEFVYSDQGYSVRYKVPRLSEPFKMYGIRHIPVYSNKIWLDLKLEKIYVANSVSDTLEISEVEKKCYNTHTYYICFPEEVTIRHSQKSCELQLIENYWGNPTDLSLCKMDNIVLRPAVQSYIMTREGISISSSIEDKLNYICDDPSRDRSTDIPIGLMIFKYRQNCVYETSSLTIYNSMKTNILQSTFSEGVDREIETVAALTEVQSNLDDFMSANGFNISYDKILSTIQTEEKDFSVSVKKFQQDFKNSQDLKGLSFWNPTHFTLQAPASQSNALSAIFWIVVVVVLVIVIGCINNCCPCCCPAIFAGFKAIFSACCTVGRFFRRRAQSNRVNEIFGPDNDPELAVSFRAGDVELGEEVVMPRNRSFDAIGKTARSSARFIASGSANIMENVRRRLPQLPPNPTAPAPSIGPGMYPDLEQFYMENKPNIEWNVTSGQYRERVICAYVPNGQGATMKIFFDPLLSRVTDRYGVDLRFITKPHPSFMEAYKEQVARTPVPECFRDERRLISLKSHPEIKFDESRHCWFHNGSGKIIAGLPPPLVDDILYEPI